VLLGAASAVLPFDGDRGSAVSPAAVRQDLDVNVRAFALGRGAAVGERRVA